MDFEVQGHLRAAERSVSSLERDGQPARAVTLSRSYPTTVEDLWDALTRGERIARWFLPISGDLELGGRYQLEGNAGGVIRTCERPAHLALTWEFGGDVSWVEARLSDDGAGRARLTLTHTALLSPHWDEYGPGATGVDFEVKAGRWACWTRAAPRSPGGTEVGRSRVRRFPGRQSAHHGQQRGMGASGRSGGNGPRRRACRCGAHHRVLHRRIDRVRVTTSANRASSPDAASPCPHRRRPSRRRLATPSPGAPRDPTRTTWPRGGRRPDPPAA